MKHLTLEDIKISKPDFSLSKAKKGYIISMWLIEWVKYSLEHGIADIGDYIPSKEDLANYLGVSVATIQNSIRYVKNLGYFNSKQSVGTSIADFSSYDLKEENSLNSGSITESKIKKMVLDLDVQIGNFIPSIKEISFTTDISQNTIRLALSNLELKGYLEKIKVRGNKYSYLYKKAFELSQNELINGIQDENFTLTHQLVIKIKNYLEKTYRHGEKILPNSTLSRMFDVSIKTINDAMKVLATGGIILPRRGRYGTIYLGKNKQNFMDLGGRKTSSNYAYCWQKTLVHLKKYIVDNFKEDDKLPSIRTLSGILGVSPNTIRRSLRSLIENRNLIAKKGKSGGIFVIELPESADSYRWLALNPDVIKMEN